MKNNAAATEVAAAWVQSGPEGMGSAAKASFSPDISHS
jgi:hypothetical protein